MKKQMKKQTMLAAALAGGASVVLAGAYGAYRYAFRRDGGISNQDVPAKAEYQGYQGEIQENINRMLEEPYQRVAIRSDDGLRLAGRYYEGTPGAPMILFFHGYRSSPEWDGGCSFAFWRQQGYHLLIAEQRAMRESQGKTITFGIRERWDCCAWARYAARHFHGPIFLWGTSMGASTVLMAANLDLPEQVRGIIADCGYDSPAEILKVGLRRRHLPVFPGYPLLVLGARLFGHFRVTEATALEGVRGARVPILLIHGQADEMVPFAMAEHLKEACATAVRLVRVPRAGHCLSWYWEQETCREAVTDFIETQLGERTGSPD